MGKYSIKDIETLTGVQAHTIRIWEQRYGILKPERSDTNIRSYSDEQLKYVLNLSFLNKHGIKISKLASMDNSQIVKEIEKLSDSAEYNNVSILGMQSAMIDFDKNKFEKIFSSCILRDGILKTMTQVIIPFLQKIGTLWATNSINPAQEHFITNLIRKKLLVAIDSIIPENNVNSKKILLYMPEGEYHEIPLLMTYYIIKRYHHDALYMGASLPLNDLRKAIEFVKPDYIVSMVTLPTQDLTINEYLHILCSSYKGTHFVLGGKQAEYVTDKIKNLSLTHSIDDIITFFSNPNL